MKRLPALLIALTVCVLCAAQDDLYTTHKSTSKKDTVIFNNEIQNIQYHLGKYHAERQVAYTLYLLSAVTGGVATGLYKSNSEGAKLVYIGSGLIGLASFCFFIDAEKWLKKQA